MTSADKSWPRVASQVLKDVRAGNAGGREVVLELLEALGQGQPPPTATWHPTGFVVLRLATDASGALRLHLWPATGRRYGRPCWPIHDHVWHLQSLVLSGVVHSLAYRVKDDANGPGVLYAVDYGPGARSCMIGTGRRISLQLDARRRTAAGQRYEISAGSFHRSHVEADRLAATLVVTTNVARAGPYVVGDPQAAYGVPVVRPAVEPSQLAGWIDELRGSLGRAQWADNDT